MLKSRAVGKPAKLAGSGRKFTRALADKTPLEDNESMQTSKDICRGLSVFHALFGHDENSQESSFHGFSPHEIRLATDKAEIRRNQVEKEHKARGVLFTPYKTGHSPFLPFSSGKANVSKTSKELPKHKDKVLQDSVKSHQIKVMFNETTKKKIIEVVKKPVEKVGLKTKCQEVNNERAIANKFVLPARSAHSSRVIKPNKRFRDIDDEDSNESGTSKKIKLDTDACSVGSSSSLAAKRNDLSDTESINITENWSSSVITASSSLQDDLHPYRVRTKVILRKAKLKIAPDPPAVKGPFSSGEELIPQKMICGICGAVRFYRYIKQTRKFGVYSCESCRKFITKTMALNSTNDLECRYGGGNCVIAQYCIDPLTGEREGNKRCPACWLRMWLHCSNMPSDTMGRLLKKLPSHMRSLNFIPVKEECSKSTAYLEQYKMVRSMGMTPYTPDIIKALDRIEKDRLAKNIMKKVVNRARRDITVKNSLSNAVTKNKVLKNKLIPSSVANKFKHKSHTKIAKNRVGGKVKEKPKGVAIKQRRLKKEKIKREEKLVRLNKLKGPRVKHVCRSASLVLGQPVATFVDTSPSKLKAVGKEFDQDSSATLSGNTRHVSEEEKCSSLTECAPRVRQASNLEPDIQNPGKPKVSTEEETYDGKARTLQDLARQHYELINGATMGDQVSTISIDFWESYDPDEVCKTGFALIGTDSFNTKAICFICGSAGMDRMIHCAACCEPYHPYCVDGAPTGQTADDWWQVDWVCARCVQCRTCGFGGGAQVSCQRCRKSYHTDCITSDRLASRLISPDRAWVCMSCLCCKSCNLADVYKFVGNLPLCKVCFKLRQKGNYCPVCQRCYDDNDFDSKMMECERCKCWVHAHCEGLSNEKYHILSILPDTVEFVCQLCCKTNSSNWLSAIESEMKAGFLAVLKSLSKNRKTCDLLKWSPTKRPSVCNCGGRVRLRSISSFPELSEQSDADSADMRVGDGTQEEQVDQECLKPCLPDIDDRKSCDNKNDVIDKQGAYSDIRTKFGVPDCSVVVKNDELQLKLDSDTISYQNPDEKPAQFSPHATSQSDSGIGSTDDEFKSTNDQCYCRGLDKWSKTPPTLLNIKKKVTSNEYSSIDSFNKEMENIVHCIQGTELLNLYYQSFQDVFPWFDPKCLEAPNPSTKINSSVNAVEDAVKSILEEKPEESALQDVSITLKGKLDSNNDYYYNVNEKYDHRACILCKSAGEGNTTEEGRLLYCGLNEWVHTNCALWSNEVFEEIDGSLQNVQSAISRSRHIRCSKCDKKGASVGCCNRSCPEAFHFICALNGDCEFFEDKSLYCAVHKNDSKCSKTLKKGPDFLVTRPVYVELEKKKKKLVNRHDVHITIGSLTISNLGECVPELSDSENAIIPCNLQCTRMFWSSLEPWRLVQYVITTKIVYVASENLVSDQNYTIDHSLDDDTSQNLNGVKYSSIIVNENEIIDVVQCLLDGVCSKDEEDVQTSADLLPPELSDAIFQDLPHDILDGISMQDIFTKMMNDDNSSQDLKSDKEHKYCTNSNSNQVKSSKRKSTYGDLKRSPETKLPGKNNDNGKKPEPQSSASLKLKTRIRNTRITSLDTLDEKENAKWSSTKILQIDGAGDCSNESSDLGSPTIEESNATPPLRIRTSVNTVNSQQTANYSWRKSRIIQVDGVGDLCSSSSECGSPVWDSNSSWKLRQVDGAVDFFTATEDSLEENPVKCTRCHRTYRNSLSFERHLQTCNADYILSCSESDSSEEDKIGTPDIRLTDTEDSDQISKQGEVSENKDDIVAESVLETLQDSSTNLNFASEQVDYINSYSNNKFDCSLPNSVLNQVAISFSNQHIGDPGNIYINTCSNSSELHVTYSSKPKTMRATFECEIPQQTQLCSGRKSPVRIRPVKTYARRKKTCTPTVSVIKPPQELVEFQTSTASPTLIIQQVPSHNVIPSFIESVPQASANSVQYQYIAALDVHEKPQVPLAIQIQPQINIQPTLIQPTVYGTLIQPNGVEQLMVNTTPAPTVEMINQQPTRVYITNVNHPMYMGVETMVSNTIMSSSQFVSGMITGSSYSATTTQVIQAAKPVIDVPQSYVVVSTPTNSVPEPVPQTIYSSHGSQPWTYNYQETFKVKEKTTYQQVTRKICHDEQKRDGTEMVNSCHDMLYVNKPTLQEVTVEKTHTIKKTNTTPGLININPLRLNDMLSHSLYSPEKVVVSEIPAQKQHKQNTLDQKQSSLHVMEYQFENEAPIKPLANWSYRNSHSNQYRQVKSYKHELSGKQLNCIENEIPVHIVSKSNNPIITKLKSPPNVKTFDLAKKISTSNKQQQTISNKKKQDTKIVKPSVKKVATKEELNILRKVQLEKHLKTKKSIEKSVSTSSNEKPKSTNDKVQLKKEQKRVPLKENKVVERKKPSSKLKKENPAPLLNPKLMYEISSPEGISICSQDLEDAWQKIFDAVQAARAAKRLPPLPQNPHSSNLKMLGLDNNSVKYLIEQLPGVTSCTKYKPTYHKNKLYGHSEQLKENPTGCARTELCSNICRKYDMFSWLASAHRRPPKLIVNSETEIVNGISRRATSLNLPMAMRFRHLKETSKEAVGVFRSDIHGRGLFCLRDIDCGEMVIEYAGEVIRAGLTDKREHFYTSKGIGCYMFRIDDHFVVDATMHGNAARFINHSCEPNCYSRVVDILGKKHILIFALRKIPQGEELTYDYKFPLEDEKITCHCLSRKCRKYLN